MTTIKPISNCSIEEIVQSLIQAIGEDPNREGLVATPARTARMYAEIFNGYHQVLHEVVNGAVFSEPGAEMITVREISFYSMCEHHMMPFFGRVQIAYIPNGKIIGLSKIPRIVELYARRLQVQERLTMQIGQAIDEVLNPHGTAVHITAQHLCAAMRGIKKEDVRLTTQYYSGQFKNSIDLRREFQQQATLNAPYTLEID